MIEDLLQEADQAKNAGDDEKAVQIYRRIIESCENDESQTSQLAYCLQELAQIYSQYGQQHEAIPLYKKLISLAGKILGEDHPDIINAGVNLARSYESNGQFERADEQYRLATGKAEKIFGISDSVSQEIRQEYFDAVANRQVVADDKLRHGLNLERASQTNPNNTITNQTAAKPTGPRPTKKYSNLPQSNKIKKLRYVAESVEEQSGNLLKLQGLKRHGKDIFYGFSVLLCIGAIFIAFSKLFVPNELPDSNLIAQRLIGSVFRSVDGANGIQFLDNKYAVLLNDVHHRKIPYYLLKGGMQDLKDMILSMAVRKENWFQLNQDELTTENGNIYYSGNAPEFSLVQKIQNFAEFATRYYAQHGCYPDRADKFKNEPGLAYINPFDNKPELPLIRRLSASYARDAIFPGVKTEATPLDCYWYLRHGGNWRDDLINGIGKTSALSLFTSQRCADGYKVTEFYVHGFDRHGKIITAGKPETYYVIGLHLGKNLNDDNHERTAETEKASVHPPERIYITPGYGVDVHFWRQFLTSILSGSVLVSLIAWLFLESKKRSQNPKRSLQPIEFIFIVCFAVWAYVSLIRLIP
jgi:hypothetical protein